MEKLIEKHLPNGSVCDVFANIFPVKKHPYLGGWEEFESLEKGKKRGKKDMDESEQSDGEEKKLGGRLLLLLAYMMVSNVLDDDSIKTQM